MKRQRDHSILDLWLGAVIDQQLDDLWHYGTALARSTRSMERGVSVGVGDVRVGVVLQQLGDGLLQQQQQQDYNVLVCLSHERRRR